ncbi:MAG: sulfatase-like hydrolase/transferase [Planctomycetota bacterium]|jgi:arylsulfatase A-like enzyme
MLGFKRFSIFLFLFCWLINVGCSQAVGRPNILLIFSDDQGYNDVGCYGSEIPTPHIDSIAKEGIKFTDWYVAAAVCTPSRFGLLTGQYPNRSRDRLLGALMTLHEEKSGIRASETTIGSVLQERGYRTALIGKWHLGHSDEEFLPTRHGFDTFYGHTGGCIDYVKLTYGIKPNWYRGEKLIEEKGYATDLLSDEAVRFVNAQQKDKPFFLYLAYNAPHYGKGWDAKRKEVTNIMQPHEKYLPRFSHIENRKRREFAAMVAPMDDGIGRVLATLEQSKLDDNTLVIFMTDNGGTTRYGGSNLPLRSGKGQFFEGGVRVPCVMKWPGKIKPGTVTDQPGSALDIFPTFCRLTGAEASKFKLDGIDLTPVLLEGKKLDRSLFWQNSRRDAFRRGVWKYVKDKKKNKEMLFNLANDLSEKTDLADKHPEILAKLKADHAKIAAEFGKK